MDAQPVAPGPTKLDRVKAKWFVFLILGLVIGLTLFLIFGVFVSSKYRSFKTKTIDAIRWNIDQSLAEDKARQGKRKELGDALSTIYGYAEANELSFVAMAVVTQSYDVTMADMSLSDSEIDGLLDLYSDIISKKGDIPMKDVEPYTRKAQNIR
ncbi:MAG: hypothetical protein P1V97_09265 [Planctomycetota bacterium]|nr:hypothetical protein [Planctomycetota bacterium]